MSSKWAMMLQMTLLLHILLPKKSRPLLMSDSLQHPAAAAAKSLQSCYNILHIPSSHTQAWNAYEDYNRSDGVLSDLLQTRLLHLQIQEKTSKQNKTK